MRRILRKAKKSLPKLYLSWTRVKTKFYYFLTTDRGYCRRKYYRKYGHYPNLVDPDTYNEIVLKICLTKPTALMEMCVDKLEVRKYIAGKGLNGILNDLYGSYDNVKSVLDSFCSFPDRFVLKATHGCGWNFVCRNKNKVDVKSVNNLLNHWMKSNFYYYQRELVYKNIRPRIICEGYLEDESEALRDYKFHCFRGEPKFFHVVDGRYTDMIYNTYNMEGELLDYEFFRGRIDRSTDYLQSIPIDKMIALSRILSAEFDYVRVDFYYCNDKIYFGELTFTPGNGSFDLLIEQDLELGKFFSESCS